MSQSKGTLLEVTVQDDASTVASQRAGNHDRKRAGRVLRGSFVAAVVAGVTAVLAGCPIYGDGYAPYSSCSNDPYASGCDGSCVTDSDCTRYGDAYCSNGYCQSRPPSQPTTCTSTAECPTGSTCGAGRTCVVGDCSATGCSPGYVCRLSSGIASCVFAGSDAGTSTDGGNRSDSGKDGASPDAGAAILGCANDAACAATGAGAQCLSGTCVLPVDQCSDGTQCRGANQQCVQGACTQTCSATSPCPTGYACDTSKGVCTGNPTPCTASVTCGSGTTCVLDRCVTSCVGQAQCGAGQVCLNGGCVTDGKPNFVCQTEGERGGPNKGCATGSVCLRHSCYIECAADAGNAGCRSSDRFDTCKSVSSTSGPVSVCGSSTNLGSECDPTQGRPCANAAICIDGFCR